ncbi:MAG TPA: cation-translocating P-type ATPase [Rhizobacter sp.]|nr:cation-translocating P-type ATPase [Rhizobacter sp.]
MSARTLPNAVTSPGTRPGGDEAEGVAGLDVRWIASADGTRQAEAVFALQGMYCGACAGVIEAALMRVPGVALAEVNGASKRARVRWRPEVSAATVLFDAVERAGYRAMPALHEPAQAAARREARQALWRLFVAGFCMMQVMMLTTPGYLAAPGDIAPDLEALMRWAGWVLSVPVLLFASGPFFQGAWRSLRQRRMGMDVPVALGIAITFVAGTAATFDPTGPFGHEVYLDSMTMFVTFLLAGRWLEARARARSTEALDALLNRLPASVDRIGDDGRIEPVPVSHLRVGDRVQIAFGQAFPGDGRLLAGNTQVDESLLTGESRPVERAVGEAVVGGTLNVGGPVQVQLSCVGEGTRYRQIVDLVQRALTERPAMLQTADRLAGPFVWGVLLLAAAAAAAWSVIDPSRALWVAVAVLIVTCPCALSLATPAALLSAAGALARRGVLVQRLDALETLAHTDTACLDKTGTLTQDKLVLAHIDMPEGADRGAMLARAASLAALSRHPLSRALAEALPTPAGDWHEVREVPGQGLEALDEQGRRWRLGAPAWAGVQSGAERPVVACACLDGHAQEQACFEFDEALRPDTAAAVQSLRGQGVQIHLLSGDADASVRAMARRLGIVQVQAGARPEDKLATMAALQAGGHSVLMVGDGVNDGPVLARADVSFALAHGSALAQQRADFIVLGSRLAEVPATRALAIRTLRVMRQNLGWSLAYNAACVPLALAGLLPPWVAGAGMALSSLFVVLNALRLSR